MQALANRYRVGMGLRGEKIDHIANQIVDIYSSGTHLGPPDIPQKAVEYLLEPVGLFLNNRNLANRPSSPLISGV